MSHSNCWEGHEESDLFPQFDISVRYVTDPNCRIEDLWNIFFAKIRRLVSLVIDA